jgi:nucleoid-associated protein YgaU
MALAKLTITPTGDSKIEPFKALFNPTSYSISKSVSWQTPGSEDGGQARESNVTLNAPLLQFGGGQCRTLSLKLFFDVTDYPLINGEKITDVLTLTNQLVKLTLKERSGNTEQPPPVCRISWGESNAKSMDFPFVGVVESLTQEFTLFDSDGKPLRANLDVSFKEFLKPEEDKRKNDPEFTTRIVKRGDTLSSIAAEMLNDPARWRIIADANQLDNPRALEIGISLSIPKVQ